MREPIPRIKLQKINNNCIELNNSNSKFNYLKYTKYEGHQLIIINNNYINLSLPIKMYNS